jgi:hypothetical protein
VPVVTLSVSSPDRVPTTTVKASPNTSLFMTIPQDALGRKLCWFQDNSVALVRALVVLVASGGFCCSGEN